MGDYTTPVEDNLLGLSSREELDNAEAIGIIRAEEYILDLDVDDPITATVVLSIHKESFGHLYEWAGKWRDRDIQAGQHIPPNYVQVPNLMYQFLDDLNYRVDNINNISALVKVLAYAHHRLVYIHPFLNGNGRSSRLITDLIAKRFGYENIELYHREKGAKREAYLKSIRIADKGDYSVLEREIKSQLKKL